jgi:hypothetical protein
MKPSPGIHVEIVIVVVIVIVVIIIVVVVGISVVVDSGDCAGRQVEGDHQKADEAESRKIVTFVVAP